MNGGKGGSTMAKIMEIIAKQTKGKSYHTYKYSYIDLWRLTKNWRKTESPKNLVISRVFRLMEGYKRYDKNTFRVPRQYL